MFQITSKLPNVDIRMYQLSGEVTVRQSSACFLCILKGSLTLTQSDCIPSNLSSDDILFLHHESEYRLKAIDSSILLFIEFHPYFLLTALGYENIFPNFDSRTCPANSILNLRHDISSLAISFHLDRHKHRNNIMPKAYQVLLHLTHEENNPSLTMAKATKTEKKLEEYVSYIKANYYRPLSLTEVADYMSYTPQYLANFLKKNLHMTFQEHITSIRLDVALLLLKFTEETPTRICALSGFVNTGSFEHAFKKKYDQTPDDFLSSFQLPPFYSPSDAMTPVGSHTLEQDYIYNYMHFVSKTEVFHEASTLQSLKINTTKRQPFLTSFSQVINIGSVTDFEKPAYRHTLQMIQKRIPFQYGRCIGLFSLITEQVENEISSYQFSAVFDLLDYMRSIQLTPFLEISNKPFHMYKENEFLQTDYRSFLDTETYDTFLYKLLPHFIRACILRYGYDEFATWKFELWARYTPAMNSRESSEDYFKRFQKVAHLMKSMVPELSIGGPGFNTYLDSTFFFETIHFFVDAPYQPDFICVYYFPYTSKKKELIPSVSGYTAAPQGNTMNQKIQSIKHILEKLNLNHIPFYVTEYSSFLSIRNYINDSTYPAIFILQQVVENYGSADVLAYWLASDLSLTYSNSSSPFFGGSGIVSKNCIPKSSFFAFEFLNQLGDQLIDRGEHYIVTCSRDNLYQILVFYGSNLNENFAKSLFSQELLLFPYSAFEDVPPLHFKLELTHLPAGTYLSKKQMISLTHGNVLDAWRQLDYFKELRSSEIQYLQNKAVPSFSIQFEQMDDTYLLELVLNRNEAVLFTLEKYN